MVKILKPGTLQKIKCDECGCLFSFEDEDTEIVMSKAITPQCEIVEKIIECPQCGKDIDLKER